MRVKADNFKRKNKKRKGFLILIDITLIICFYRIPFFVFFC